jgi:hypothetical protein
MLSDRAWRLWDKIKGRGTDHSKLCAQGNFDFTISSTQVDIEALAARYQNQDFWLRSMSEGDDDGPGGVRKPRQLEQIMKVHA